MDVSGWAPEKIMQLPDHVFGERHVLACCGKSSNDVPVWDISEVAVHDISVLWDLTIWPIYVTDADDYVRIAWGQYLPKSTAEMDELAPLVRGLGKQGGEPRKIPIYFYAGGMSFHLRKLVYPGGRRMVIEVYANVGKYTMCHVVATVSSLPKEVPDWLISGQVKSL